jgi:hypothetical protein
VRTVVNFVFLAAVLAINYTLLRPSPVDVLFTLALLGTVCTHQILTRNILILNGILLLWLGSLYVSSIALFNDPEVVLMAQKITYAISIATCASLVGANWDERDLTRFLKAIVASTTIAAVLGIVGFLLQIDELTWDGRAKGLLDDPNMYAAFLLPGVMSCMYLLSRGESRALYLPPLVLLLFGLVMGFSRAGLGSLTVWGTTYYLILNRRNLPKAIFYALAAVAAVVCAVAVASLFDPEIGAKIADRSTVAKEYDLGHGGRYSRYELAWPLILSHPLGLGLLEIDRIFDEPIHNIWISSFLNYGWVAGLAFTVLLAGTVTISLRNYRVTRHPICLCVFFCWLAIQNCALLHEAERWRHLWLFVGLAWGLNARNFLPRRTAAAAAEAVPVVDERYVPPRLAGARA